VLPQNGDVIYLPFGDIVARFPGSLAPLVSSSVTGTFPLPITTALAQLPTGAVRIRFAELRESAPPGTFANNASLDETLVDLPLPKILAGMNPALLVRRSGQTEVTVPNGVSGVFASKAKTPNQPVAPVAAPVAAAAPAPAATSAASDPETLSVKISALFEFWPESVRQDITQFSWNNASVSLPMNRLGAALKMGRVSFTWGELIRWIDGSSADVATPHKAIPLDLPLKVIAPLFMSQQRAPAAQKSIAVNESVPNLFAVPVKPSEPAAAMPVPPPAIIPETAAPAPVTPPSAPADVLGEIFGQPAKKEWSPQEITQKIDALPGVGASLIAMSDGFLVAGALPPPVKSETMAAFLPQIFGRLAHYSGEVQLGPLSALTMLAGSSQCTIFKTGALYLAVVGKPGEILPDAVLHRVAGELAKRNP
jgi:predicted regulator of Ras-like GTPase activity (Roadblock/LC7/MglB family)